MTLTACPPLTIGASMRWPLVRDVLTDAHDVKSVVEVGCGQGALSYRLAIDHEYRGYEPDIQSFEVALRRLEQLDRVELMNEEIPETPDRRFDALVAFEVLEHIRDDAGSLARWVDWVRPGGLVIVSVPANPDRFGPWDEAVGHVRRYTRADLSRVFGAAGLRDASVWSTGVPLGYITEMIRNRLAPESSGDLESDTYSSGRRLQPGGSWWRLVEISLQPFTVLQRAFMHSNLGTGLVGFARKT